MQTKASILYVEDDADTSEMIRIYLSSQGYRVKTACDSAEALRKVGEDQFDLFMIDVRLPDGLGADLALKLRELQPTAPIVYYTASAMPQERIETMSKCGEAYLIKPDSFEDIEATIENLVAAKRIAEQQRQKNLSGLETGSF
jgi:DNA-binding response OmpR family regulator